MRLHEGARVATAEGAIASDQLQVGDLVWARDEETGDASLPPVLKTMRHGVSTGLHRM